MMPGIPERRTHSYVRLGSTSLFAALDTASGFVPRSRPRYLEMMNRLLASLTYVHAMYLDEFADLGGREIWGFPKKLAGPKTSHENETVVCTLH
jgi:hypothetical protein